MGMTKRYPEPFQREKTKGTTYYFTVTENSGTSKKKRKNLSTGETTKERAREYIREFMDKLQATTSQQTFRDYSAEYFIWELDKKPTCPHAARLVQEGRTTGRQHSLTMRRLLERWIYTDEIFSDLKMNEIRRAHVIDLRTRLMAQEKANSAGKALEAVKVILSEAEFRQEIDMNPGARVSKPKFDIRVRGSFTVQEVRDILKLKPGRMATDQRISAAFHALFCLGIRCGELRALRWRHLDIKQRSGSIIEAAKGESGNKTGLPKWDKTRKIALPKMFIAELEAWRKIAKHTEPDDCIFCDENGKQLSQQVIKDSFNTILQAATKDSLF